MNVNTRIPISFTILNSFESANNKDSRFLEVEIFLCHTGANLNGSFFSKEVLKDAIPTLANTPILAYIEDNSDGEKDFSDHRAIIVKEDGVFKYKYIGKAIGLIPESNNARFEMRMCDDGVEREFLVCNGLVWNEKWDDPIDILERDGKKAQSMELHEKYEGHWGDDNLFHFTKISFYGACALGLDVMPAMRSSSIEVINNFSLSDFTKELNDKMEEFKASYTQYQLSQDNSYTNKNKEGEVMNEKLLELLAKFSLTEEILQAKEFKLEDYSTEEELEAKISSIADEVALENNASTCEKCGSVECSCSTVKVYTEEEYNALQASYDQLKVDFDVLTTAKGEVDTQLSEVTEKLSTFEALESEVVELREFKTTTLSAQRQAQESELFEQFSEQLTDEELAPVKEKASSMELADIERELFAIVGKKNTVFSKKSASNKVPLIKDKGNNGPDYLYLLERVSQE